VIYAFADVTVLQAYCGNETVGIPTYGQQIKTKNRAVDNNEMRSFSKKSLSTGSLSSHEEQIPDSPASEEDCFCCCSHMLLGFNFVRPFTPKLVVKKSFSNFSLKYLRSNSHLPLFYQPPKFA
jgi:hypothetical protein